MQNLSTPVLFVTGNYEGYVGIERVTKALQAANVNVLRNQTKDFGPLRIIGIDYSDNRKKLQPILQHLSSDSNRFTLLMTHRPVELETLSMAHIDFALAGHTHAGQIFPFNYIVRLFYPYLSDLHKYNDHGTSIYVTSGTGTWGPRMRLGSGSEIVLLKIRKNLPPPSL